MNIGEVFPSKYLKAADLDGRELTVRISHMKLEEVGSDKRMVCYFERAQKGLVLNKTNANMIALAYGQETEDWIGKEITLFEFMTDYKGTPTLSIRVKIPRDRKPARREPQVTSGRSLSEPPIPAGSREAPPPLDDDDIPF